MTEEADERFLPNVQQARIARTKTVGYLLRPRGTDDKAGYFLRFGFTILAPEVLEAALREHARAHPVERVVDTPFGRKFIIAGRLETPDGRSPNILAIWQVDRGTDAPRFVTAYRDRRVR